MDKIDKMGEMDKIEDRFPILFHKKTYFCFDCGNEWEIS